MNKYIVTLLIALTCLLTACGYRDYIYRNVADVSGQAVSGGGTEMNSHSAAGGGDTAISGSVVHSSDNVTADMQTADYWIGKTVSPDKILMTPTEIAEYNKLLMTRLSPATEYYDLLNYGETIDKASLDKLIRREHDPSKTYFIGEAEIAEESWDDYRESCDLESLDNLNPVEYGIVCSRADVRVLPTTDNITNDRGDTGHDVMQSTALAVNEPVLVLHRSLDEKWLFVIANEHAGWVLQDKVGLCPDKERWLDAQKIKDFIVVTGDEVTVRTISTDTPSEPLLFTMGTKLALAEKSEYSAAIGNRNILDNYIVKVPVREQNGQLGHQYAVVPLGKDVSHGFLDYTRGNVIRQAFKLLGNPYGWGGMNGGRDCSSMTRDIYLCFGFRLPRDASVQAKIPGRGRISLKDLSERERTAKFRSMQPGTILQMPGHVMIYLGCQDRRYYVISANGTFIPDHDTASPASGSKNYQTRLVTVNDLEVRSPSNGKTWKEQLAVIVGIP